MAEDQKANQKTFDPFEPFREIRDSYLDSMAKTMVEAVNTESYAQMSGAMLDSYLSASAPFREALEESMTQALQQLSLPSRQEVATLAERFTNLEMRLDDMDAKLDLVVKAVKSLSEQKPSAPEPEKKKAAPVAQPSEPKVTKSAAPKKRTLTAARKVSRSSSGEGGRS